MFFFKLRCRKANEGIIQLFLFSPSLSLSHSPISHTDKQQEVDQPVPLSARELAPSPSPLSKAPASKKLLKATELMKIKGVSNIIVTKPKHHNVISGDIIKKFGVPVKKEKEEELEKVREIH